MAMSRRPFHGWRIKQEIQKFTAFREWAGSPTRAAPLSSLSPLRPLPPLLLCCQNLLPLSHYRQNAKFHPLSTSPSFIAYYSHAPETNPNSAKEQAEDPSPNVQSLRESNGDGERCGHPDIPYAEPSKLWRDIQKMRLDGLDVIINIINICSRSPRDHPLQEKIQEMQANFREPVTLQEELDRFYQEMSKEVETILHERDRRALPEELPKSVVVTCVRKGGLCQAYVLRTKYRSQQSCREVEVEAVVTYVRPQVVAMRSPSDEFPLKSHDLGRDWKVVNKLEVSHGRSFAVACEEVMSYGGKVIRGDHPEQVKLQGRGQCISEREWMVLKFL
ncbi:hypothetical protein BT93_K1828 [Corymbia citriodora subsp. variegata]|nr:hypothetical protein BT93_K1828 [Corymbia citriodora subsp. variegata]KAF8007955.1 hypothetical protein BT93_K1828 [Corymbia citriodora subsp. variegata]